MDARMIFMYDSTIRWRWAPWDISPLLVLIFVGIWFGRLVVLVGQFGMDGCGRAAGILFACNESGKI